MGKASPLGSASGNASAAASDTAPRTPVKEITKRSASSEQDRACECAC